MNSKGFRFALGFFTLGLAASASAASVYRVERVDYREGAESLQIKMVIDDAGKRVDVLGAGKLRISFIEYGDRVMVVDYSRSLYAVGEPQRRSREFRSPESWQETARKQFVLGAYCSVYELRWSDAVYQERCAQTMESPEQRKVGTRIGTFLELVVATRDSMDLFLAAMHALPESPRESQMPVVVRHVEGGRVACELRVIAVANVASSSSAFDVPRGFKRVPFSAEALKEARL